MTSETLFRAIGEVSDDKIIKADSDKLRIKRNVSKHILLAAVIAAVAIVLSGIALAAIGFDFGALYNSIFNSKEAAPFVQTGDGITVLHNEGDVSVEALAAYYEPARSGLYMQLRITDLSGSGRLTESLVFLRDNGYISDLVITTGKVNVLSIDESTVVVSLFITSFTEGQTVSFDSIVSGDATITGKWEYAISNENVLSERMLYGEFEGSDAQVFLGGTVVEIIVFADYRSEDYPDTVFPHDFAAEDTVIINLLDGSSVRPKFEGYFVDNSPQSSFVYGMEFVNPADVVSVVFCGTTIGN